jgi:hypothetical protein
MKFLNEIPFEPRYPPGVLDQAKEWLRNNREKFAATANFAIFNSQGEVEHRTNQVCHRSISISMLHDRCLVASEIGLRRRSLMKVPFSGGSTEYPWELSWDVAEPFLRWFLYDSWMGRFIINRDDLEFVKEYGIIVSADCPAPLLQNTLIVSRHFWEVQPDSFHQFKKLVENGCNKTLAYLCCFCVGYSFGGQNILSAVTSLSNHRAHVLPNLAGIRRALSEEVGSGLFAQKGKYLNDPTLLYRSCTDYNGGLKIFTSDKDRIFDTESHFVGDLFKIAEFRSALKDYRTNTLGLGMYHPPNPFERSRVAIPMHPDQVSYKELYDFVLPYVTENPHVLESQEVS